MADLNALIAQGAQFRQPTDPFAQYGQLQQLESARQANALNMMKMDEYRRGIQEQNALRSSIPSDFDINNPAHVNAVLRASPSAGASFLEKFSQGAKERELAAKAKNEALKFNLDNSRSLLVGVNDQPSYDSWRAYSIKNMPELAQILPAQFSQESKSALLTTADDISKRLTAAPSYQSVAPSHTLTKDGVPIYTAAAAPEKASAPPAMVAEYTFAKTPEGGGYVGSFEKFVRDRAIAARPPGAPAQPVAPTITTIVDPTDPTKMIAIDAKRYQGGGAGSPGVIGVSGKEPGAALRENKVEAGKTQLADDLDNLRASFQKLDAMRAIPSTERNVLSNIMSATGASGVGQTLGRATGTEAQVERDVINSARQRLVTSIKNATGMSAQQLNSNVELQTMLKSISDPGQSVQAAMRIIDDIEQAYVKGNGKLPKGNAPETPPAIVPGKAGGPAVVPTKTKSGATASNW